MKDDAADQPRTSHSPQVPLSLFAGLDQATIELITDHLQEQTLSAGHVVFEDNAPGDTLYIIESGCVQVSKTFDTGQEHVFADLGPGEFFGEMALLEEKPRSARVTTSAPTRLLAMPRQTFNLLIERHPVVAVNFLRMISSRLRQRNHEQELLLQELTDKNAKLQAAMVTVAEHERVKRDLEIAREIQRQMLPVTFPRLPRLQLYATTVPSRWVGGDFYEAVCLEEQCVGLLLGDVAGKGIPAAMQMARLMGEFHASVSHRADPEGVMQVLNELLCQRNVQWTSFVTMQYVVVDMARRHIQFICAGHPPIVLCHADGEIEYLGSLPNLPLGIDDAFVYRQETYVLQPGDRLLLYSDGAYELQNAQGDMLGLSRLAELFAAAPSSPEAAIDAIQKALSTFSEDGGSHDDTTFLCASVT